MASKIKVDQLETADGSGTIALQNQLSGMTSASMPTGSVLQVLQSTMADDAATTSTSFQDIPLSVAITPSSTSNKILVQANVWIGVNNNGQYGTFVQVLRGSTQINMGNAEGTRPRVMGAAYSDDHDYDIWNVTCNYLDSPNTTSATIYKAQFRSGWANTEAYINRSGHDGDNAGGARTMCTLTVTEMKG